ncbi:peptidylprolyl isomerase [Paenibacillus sp. UMB4589-SE434]|uniref:peptidylprolyl isomerase n=1 Tax=Paenibacillus sp. UMB4589-SE434 TaxID=3046314 RepID=UPI00254C733C|nr:peptidylprolyl isomerase [Paenibacillus sp. UMB4589-SE434]MDK8184098.1 peptidylprolyl isomerase [Paenibacillus sp. UMB4589-SE434]
MLQNNTKRSWKRVTILLTLVLALTFVAACGNKNASDDTVVATYEGGQVTQAQFDKELANMLFFYPDYAQLIEMDDFRQYFIKQQIAYLYLTEKAPDKSKQEGAKRADEQIAGIKKQVGDDQFKKMLEAQKLTEDDVKTYMNRILTVVADYNAKVTDEQVKAQFGKDKTDFTTASVRHVLIGFKDKNQKDRKKEDALKLAKDVQDRLKKGEDFAKLAKELSDDTGSAENGGLYKDVAVSKWVKEFKEAALTLPLNQISDPVETEYGYHVMKVENRTDKTFDKLTQVEKDTLRTKAATELMNTFMEKDLEKIIKKIDLPKTEKKEEEKPADKKETDKPATPKEEPKTETGK